MLNFWIYKPAAKGKIQNSVYGDIVTFQKKVVNNSYNCERKALNVYNRRLTSQNGSFLAIFA